MWELKIQMEKLTYLYFKNIQWPKTKKKHFTMPKLQTNCDLELFCKKTNGTPYRTREINSYDISYSVMTNAETGSVFKFTIYIIKLSFMGELWGVQQKSCYNQSALYNDAIYITHLPRLAESGYRMGDLHMTSWPCMEQEKYIWAIQAT